MNQASDPANLARVKQADKRGIVETLKEKGVGWYMLTARGDPWPDREKERREIGRYAALFTAQLNGDLTGYTSALRSTAGRVTVAPSPEVAAEMVMAYKANAAGKEDEAEGDDNRNQEDDGKDPQNPKDPEGGQSLGDKLRSLLDKIGEKLKGSLRSWPFAGFCEGPQDAGNGFPAILRPGVARVEFQREPMWRRVST